MTPYHGVIRFHRKCSEKCHRSCIPLPSFVACIGMAHRLPSYRLFGIRTLTERFRVFLQELHHLQQVQDEEAIHDLRVASRRFHAASLLFKECVDPVKFLKLERRVRRIRKAAGVVRDGDVQLQNLSVILRRLPAHPHRSGLERLQLRLTQRREHGMERIRTAIGDFETSISENVLRASLSRRTPRSTVRVKRAQPLRQRAAQEISSHLDQLLRFEQFVNQPSAISELHQMRIAAKRFRYVMEIFNPVFSRKLKPYIRAVRSLQDILGEMHDCDIWIATIPEFIEKERARTTKYFGSAAQFSRVEKGLLFLLEYSRNERMNRYNTFVRRWKSIDRERLWKRLIDILV